MNKEELKQEVCNSIKRIEYSSDFYKKRRGETAFILGLIDHLEEPEENTPERTMKKVNESMAALGQAFGDQFEFNRNVKELNELGYIVKRKPVIPKMIVQVIEYYKKERYSSFSTEEDIIEQYNTYGNNFNIYAWIKKNHYDFVIAYENGYEIEKEPCWVSLL